MGAMALVAAPAYADDATPSPSPTPTPTAGDDAKHGYLPDPKILSIDVSPSTVVVNRHGSVEVTATVRTKDVKSLSIDVWEPKEYHHGGGDGDGHWFSKSDGPGYDKAKYDVTSKSWTFTWSHKTGLWKVHVEAVGVNGAQLSAERGFFVKHQEWAPRPKGPKATRIVGFDATPEPVRKGHKLALQGKLQVAQCYGDWYYEWDSYVSVHGGDDYCQDSRDYWHDWHWLGQQDIDVYFLPSGSHKWKYVGTTESDPDGSFYTKVRALKSGTWGVRFDGTSRLKGSEAYDYVKVVRH
ncbi:hypothetical protein MPTA5024_00530 [Microbispora sp. ATCC PTA-5024]|nr:hypothetical protein MPTA5024_00530 [Microbispora sp. ATCC PTA-5024]